METEEEKQALIDLFLEEYTNCPNPTNYPKAAEFYVKTLLYHKQKEEKKRLTNPE